MLRSLQVFDALLQLKVADPEQRFWVEYPTNPLGIEKVARLLASAASKR